MARFLHIPESTNLAFHALAYLSQTQGSLFRIGDIAKDLDVSEAHLSKVLQAMRRAGFVKATRGPNGGYLLARHPKEIFLLEIHEALHGKHIPHECLLKAPVCVRKSCVLSKFARKVDDEFRAFLLATTLEAFVSSSS